MKFIKTLAMLLVITSLSIACATRSKPAYITTLSFAGVPSPPLIVPVPLPSQATFTSARATSSEAWTILGTQAETEEWTTLGTQTERGLEFTLYTVFFETDKANLLPEGREQVNEFAKAIQQYDNSRSILIEGHTDNTGSKAYNQRLSDHRVQTVQDALIIKGIDSERLMVKGFGENAPIATNATIKGRQQNRRVEIVLLNEETENRFINDGDI
jgi:outer membrane protein OmpA-like peptidoglycan-associated protein